MAQAVAAVASFVAKALIGAGVSTALAKAIAIVAVNIAVSMATNAAIAAISQPKDAGERLLTAAQWSDLSADPLSERVIAYGETAEAGEVVFQQVTSDRRSVNFVISLADAGQVQPHEWTGTIIDGEWVEFDEDGICTSGAYGSSLQVRFYGGTPDQTADAQLITESGGVWTSAHRGRGCVYAIMRAEVSNDEKFPGGRPRPMFRFKGRRVYDPRLDSTKPGGSGSHRIDDESTWEWSNNAALCIYDYSRGIFVQGEDGSRRRVAGLGLPLDLIDESWVIASANACDLEGWTIDGLFTAGSDPADVLLSMAVHMGGRIATRKGKLAPIAGYDWPSTLTIGEDDLVSSVKIKHAKKWREVHNATKAAYRDGSEEGRFEGTETNLFSVASWVYQDNGETFERTISLPFTHDREKATRIAKLDLYRKRAPRTIEAPVRLAKSRAVEGDFVDVVLPSHGIDETYEVVGYALDQAGFATLSLELWNPDGLDWSYVEAGEPPDWGVINRLDLTPPTPEAGDWGAIASSETSSGGTIPALYVEGVAPSWVDAVIFEWRANTSTDWNFWSERPRIEAGSLKITGLAPAKVYQISIRYRFGSRVSDRLVFTAGALTDLVATDANTAGVADSIVAQGTLATRNTVESSHVAAGVGKNCVLDGDFRQASGYWTASAAGSGSVVASVATANGIRYRQLVGSGMSTGLSHALVTMGTGTQAAAFQCNTGDKIEVSGYVGGANLLGVQVNVRFWDASGTYVSDVLAGSSASIGAGAGDLTSYTRIGGIVTAPTNARRAVVSFVGYNSTAAPTLRVALPYIGHATSGQTQLTPWNIGFEAVPGADITSANTAAAITGQGAFATLSQANLGASGRVYREDGTTRVTDAAAITSLGTAAAIAGQGALATKNAVDLSSSEVTNKSLANLDATASVALGKMKTGEFIAGEPTPGSNALAVVAMTSTWETVAICDVAIPDRRYCYFPDVEIEFDPAGSATTAGIRIVELDPAEIEGPVVRIGPVTRVLSTMDPSEWRAPSSWGTTAHEVTADGETRRFKLQVNRTSGSGDVVIQPLASLFTAGVF